mgnify:CR=1 FL=1
MNTPLTPDEIERLATRRAKAKLGWYAHATVYVAVNAGLIAISATTGRNWAIYPALGWGFGLLMHGISVWAFAPGGDMLERLVERERARLGARGNR